MCVVPSVVAKRTIMHYTVVYFGSTVARLVSPRPAPQTRRHDDATEGASFFLREALGA